MLQLRALPALDGTSVAARDQQPVPRYLYLYLYLHLHHHHHHLLHPELTQWEPPSQLRCLRRCISQVETCSYSGWAMWLRRSWLHLRRSPTRDEGMRPPSVGSEMAMYRGRCTR
jgi:hypothetical protein